ncbi:glycosyltransferase family 2 protein [Bacteroides acidifaciens]|uniref:glycosyltransferase family 2 protein n=2 Tax=Bacteroides acidifaciens TaxID=85831 RepID=UPI0025AE3556|nr:glycosyltransferase family 2 protein [Bacteroides acidifaciens]
MDSENSVENIYKEMVTIALATYNVAPYLRESLDRMVGQTLKDIEILCIDDASTDGTVDILREYAMQDSRIRLIEKSKNEGLAVSRNTALELTKGDYVCFVDGDDLMDFDLMEKAYDLAVKEKADVVMWDYYEFGEHLFNFVPKDAPSSLLGVSSDDRHTLIQRMAFTWVRLFKTSSIRELGIHFPEGRTKQDLPVHWLTTACLNRIALLPQRKYAYRISNTQTSSYKGRVMLDIVYVLDYTERLLCEHAVFEKYSKEFYHMQLSIWRGMYCGIYSKYKLEALDEIRSRYNTLHKKALATESRSNKWFYKGVVEGNLLVKTAYKCEKTLKMLYRKVSNKNIYRIISIFY